jgi:mannosyltransferase
MRERETALSSQTDSQRDPSVIIPNFNRRFSGVTASVISIVPSLLKFHKVRTIGKGLPDSFPQITWSQLLKVGRRGSWRIWHASRNIEMLAGLILRKIFRLRLILIWTSHAQRRHTLYTRMLYKRMDRLITTTRAAASFLDKDAEVVPLGVDPDCFRPPNNRELIWKEMNLPGKYGIGIFGRLRPQKGTQEFIDALCRVLPERPEWTAFLIGQTTPAYLEFKRCLEQKVVRAGLRDRVRFVGKVENFSDIPRWYQAMSVVAVPSRVEGFGLTCLEAMASGCSVVATQTGVFPEIIEDGQNGWLVPCGDAGALTERLLEITRNPVSLNETGKLARKKIMEGYTIDKTAEKTAKVYDKALSIV